MTRAAFIAAPSPSPKPKAKSVGEPGVESSERNAAGSTAMSAPGANALASPRRAPPTHASAAAKDSDNGASGATC